jgi:branched-subunit amino acid ABC-type transport system permease component
MSFVEVLEQAVGTLVLGSKYAMVALGLAVVFSVLGLINFAHGELVVVAACMSSEHFGPRAGNLREYLAHLV